jgi:hypothetical protein
MKEARDILAETAELVTPDALTAAASRALPCNILDCRNIGTCYDPTGDPYESIEYRCEQHVPDGRSWLEDVDRAFLAALSEKGWTLAPVEGLEELWALFDAADAEQAAEDKVRSRKGRFLPSFFDTTARHAFQEASVAHVRRALTTDTGRNE